MRIRRTPWKIAAVACCLASVLSATTTLAAVSHLKSAKLRANQAPAGFSRPHLKVYTHFVPTMQVTTSIAGRASTSSCSLPASFQGDGWTQGLIEAFDRSGPSHALELCASLFADSHGAHAAYLTEVSTILTPRVKLNLAHAIRVSRIGDEASGITTAEKKCACSQIPDLVTYEIVFRHDNALLDLSYAGPPTFSLSSFERLVTGTNTKLR